jgi:acyl-CoA reductase-like NAD-dependent aldehyde dehydrogenase
MDVLYKLFAENEVVVMKMNPVNEAGGPHIEKMFAPLVQAGVFAVVYGGGEVGKHLTDHPLVETIHITGSDKTHDVIIWGATPEEQEKNKGAGTPRLTKPISSELGCVTPVLVLPGNWSDADIAFQADQVAGMVTQNGSFNCNAAKAIVTWKGWSLREKFMAAVEDALKKAPARKAYYPGAEQRYRAFLEKYPNHKVLGQTGEGVVPWTLIPDVPPKKGEYALSTEAFCGVVADTALEAKDESDFFDVALAFANDTSWGTLSCMVLAHPTTQAHAKFDGFVAGLRYGGVAINGWAGSLFGLAQTTWGAFPGHPLDNIESGRGVVHNTFLFDHPQKSVVRFPWRISPKPVWSPSHKTLDKVGKALFAIEAEPSILKLPPLLIAAFRG